MFCSRCGTQLVEGAAFCPRCGAQVAPVAGQVAAMVGQPPITAEVSPKSRLAATLLACPWLVVGLFGAHRFYVGKIRSAVGMLLVGLAPMSCGIGAVAVLFTSDLEAGTPPALFFVLYGLTYITGLAAFVWSLVDFIIAVSGNFKDTQGRPITKW